MKLQIPARHLQEKLANVQRITDAGSSRGPQLSHVMIECSNGNAWMWATNLTETLRQRLQATIIEEGSACAPAKKLHEIAKELEDDIVIASEQKKGEAGQPDSATIMLKCASSKFKMAALPTEQFPKWPDTGDMKPLAIDAEQLNKTLTNTAFAVADTGQQPFNSVVLIHILPNAKQLVAVATDGHRLATETMDVQPSQEEVKLMVPKKAAQEMVKLLQGGQKATFSWSRNFVVLHAGETTFVSLMHEVAYPNYEAVIPKDFDLQLDLPKERFESSLRRMKLMGKENGNKVTLDISNGAMSLFSQGKDIGDANEQIDIRYDSDPVKVSFNVDYILSALAHVEADSVKLLMKKTLAPALMTVEDSTWKYVIMPIR